MKIGILQAGIPPEQVVAEHGDYIEQFSRFLGGYGFTFGGWSVVEDVFPEGPEDADGWLISGSKHGVYEDLQFIPKLEALVRQIIAADKPLVGVCFGHQIIAQALGGHVEKYEGGWCVGPVEYTFGDETETLNAWHQDQVITPPQNAQTLASTDFCAHAALLYPGHAYTVQPHPEFPPNIVETLLTHRGPGIVPQERIDAARALLDTPLHRRTEADRFAHFFKTRSLA